MKIIGVLLIVLGVAVAGYVGVYLMLFGGIIQFIEGVKMTPVDSSMVALGIVRVVFASLVGGICFWLGIVLGGIFISCGNDK